MKLTFSKKIINVCPRKVGFFGKFFGLMFRSFRTKSLLFEFRKDVLISIHSFFVFFPFLAIWLDERNRVIDYMLIKPFTFRAFPKERFRKLVEVPLNYENQSIIENFLRG